MMGTAWSVASVVASAMLAALAGAGGASWILSQYKPPAPIMIVDATKTLASVAADATLDDDERRAMAERLGHRFSTAIDRHVSEGVIVLDASAVVRAPGELYVVP